MKIKKGYSWKIVVMIIISILLFKDTLYSQETLRLPIGREDDTLNRIKTKTMSKNTKKFEKYLLQENYYWTILSVEMKALIVRRIRNLERVKLELSDGSQRSIVNFYKYILSLGEYEDKLDSIIVYGSYLFSPKPGDIDIVLTIRLDNDKEVEKFIETMKSIENNMYMNSYLKARFPEKNDRYQINPHYEFLINKQEHLVDLYLLSGVMIYGNLILQSDLDYSIFLKKTVDMTMSLIEFITDTKKDILRVNSRKMMHRFLQATLLIHRINPEFLLGINLEDVYKFFIKYSQPQKTLEAIDDLKNNYMAPEKCCSIYAFFLLNLIGEEVSLMENLEDQNRIINELPKVIAYFWNHGNIQAAKTFWLLYNNIKNQELQKKIWKEYNDEGKRLRVGGDMFKKSVFDDPPEVKKLKVAVDRLRELIIEGDNKITPTMHGEVNGAL